MTPTPLASFVGLFTQFRGPSWASWRALLTAIDSGLAGLDPMARAVVCELTGRSTLPATLREFWFIVGRRAGKSIIAALLAVWQLTCRSYSLAVGEVGVLVVVAADRRQARVVKRYISGLLRVLEHALSAPLIANETTEAIELTNGLVAEIHTCSYRALRGYTVIGAICDEVAFWSDDASANPDREVLVALRAAMASVPEGWLVCITTPFARRGEAWQVFEQHFGRESARVLVVNGSSQALNPTLDQDLIAAAYEQDPIAADAEYGGKFRRDVDAFVSREALTAVLEAGVREIAPPANALVPCVHFDGATGAGGDAAAVAVAFPGEIARLAALRYWRPPFDPAAVIYEVADLCRRYGAWSLTIDRFAPGLLASMFDEYGVACVVAARDTSTAYLELLALINSGRVRLLDEPVLLKELQQLERRPGASGRNIIGHPARGHDDVAAAAAQALVHAAAAGRVLYTDQPLHVTVRTRRQDEQSGEFSTSVWAQRPERALGVRPELLRDVFDDESDETDEVDDRPLFGM